MRAKILASFLDEEHRKWWTLVAVAFGLFMIMLDNTVVNVALPSIQRDLHVSVSQLEWVVNGYFLTFAVLMLSGGKLADLLGRRRIFIAGLVVFTLSSLACGLATSGGMLIAFRAVQGIGAAMMNPATLSIITATFPPRQRGMAMGIWVGVSAVALALGPITGGLLSQHAHWSWIFFINVPIGVFAILAARIVIRETKDTSSEQRLDLPGLATSGGALLALTYALIEANAKGWTSAEILSLFVVAAVGFAAFIALERRQRAPMLDLSLFRDRTFTGANLTMLLVALSMFGVFFFVSLFVQNILGYSPVQAGASFLPMTLCIIFFAPVADERRHGTHRHLARALLAAERDLDLLESVPCAACRRRGHGDGDDADDRGCDERGARGQGRDRLRRPEQLAPGRRIARDRDHGGDPRFLRHRFEGEPGLPGPVRRRVPGSAPRRRRDRVRGRDRRLRIGAGYPAPACTRGRDGMKGRLPASERRAAVVDTACRVFARCSYRGATTAEIAREAGVTEPILYRHFDSKQALYFACIDDAWGRVRRAWEGAVEAEDDPRAWLTAMASAFFEFGEQRPAVASLWMHALTESGDEPEVRKFLRRHLRDVHEFVAGVLRRCQEAG